MKGNWYTGLVASVFLACLLLGYGFAFCGYDLLAIREEEGHVRIVNICNRGNSGLIYVVEHLGPKASDDKTAIDLYPTEFRLRLQESDDGIDWLTFRREKYFNNLGGFSASELTFPYWFTLLIAWIVYYCLYRVLKIVRLIIYRDKSSSVKSGLSDPANQQ